MRVMSASLDEVHNPFEQEPNSTTDDAEIRG
jgi:hypothetical protein